MQTPKRKPNPYSLLPKDHHMTKETILKLEQEAIKLEKKIRPKVIEEMQQAAENGDFSENHAYQMAKWKLRGINGRIEEIQNILKRAIPIEIGSKDGKVRIGATVTIEVNGKQKTYQILGAQEANPSAGKISHLSPLGAKLLNNRIGDVIKMETDDGVVEYKIVDVR